MKINPRTQAMVAVGTVITFLTLFFLFIFIQQQKTALSDAIDNEQKTQQRLTELLIEQISQRYKSRIQSLATKRTQIIRSFAEKNRTKLTFQATQLLEIFKTESPHFKSLFFVNSDNTIFLRAQIPDLHSDDASDLSPLIVEGNRSKKCISGFEIVKHGLSYRVVHPVFENRKYIGLVGFGIDADFFISELHQTKHTHLKKDCQQNIKVALVFPKSELKKAVFLNKTHNISGDHAIVSEKNSYFQKLPDTLNFGKKIQRLIIDGKNYALINTYDFKNINNNTIASTMLLEDIEVFVAKTKKTIAVTIITGFCLLLFAITMLYFNFNLLFKKITELNISLAQSNKELEYSVERRTNKLQQEIIDRKKAEKDKLLAQQHAADQEKHALIGKIAGKMAHDFNNVLGVIMGNAELSLIDCKDEETEKTFELILEQTLRGRNLTKNLVAFAKTQEPKQEFFKISEKLDLVLNLLRKDLEGIEIIKTDKPDVPDLLADTGMIEHAIVNLIQNSIHAVSMVEHPKIIIRTYSSNDNISFEIEDNGCGISKENMNSIYEPSFSLKGNRDITSSYTDDIKGTGYGLANVNKYISQHKGAIAVESEPGSGTKFTISLPVIKKELTNDEKTEIQKEIIHSGKYILLVEDETAISNIQYSVLTQEPCNHKVGIANNGQIAMDLFDRNQYDFISLDYVLPGGINGLDVYNYIRKTNKTIPILFISGNIEFLESIKALKQNDSNIDHLTKPCQNKDYVSRINKLLEKTLKSQ